MPWSAQKEAAGGEVCAKYFLGTIDDVVHETGLGWTELMEISIKRVWSETYTGSLATEFDDTD